MSDNSNREPLAPATGSALTPINVTPPDWVPAGAHADAPFAGPTIRRRLGRMTACDAIDRHLAEGWDHASYPGATVFIKGNSARVVMPDGRTGDVVWDDEPNDGTRRPGSPDGSLATETRKPGSLE